jgi:hypothetical protein
MTPYSQMLGFSQKHIPSVFRDTTLLIERYDRNRGVCSSVWARMGSEHDNNRTLFLESNGLKSAQNPEQNMRKRNANPT